MKVKALAKGQYKGIMREAGTVFEIEDKTEPIYKVDGYSHIIQDEKGNPIVVGERTHLESWMQEVKIVPLKVMGNMLPKEAKLHENVRGDRDAKI